MAPDRVVADPVDGARQRRDRAIEANGVPICEDRPGVDRVAVRKRLAEEIDRFLRQAFAAGSG